MAKSRYFNNDILKNYYLTFKRIPKEKLDKIPSYEYNIKYQRTFRSNCIQSFWGWQTVVGDSTSK